MQIFDLGLQFARVLLGDTTAENYRQLVGSAEVAIGVQQSVAQLIQRCTPAEDQVLAVLHLGEEQLMPATVLAPFLGTKERNQALQPFVPTADEVIASGCIS
jgi:hypothetical protein